MSATGPTKIFRKIAAARLVLGFERVWAASLWPMLIVAFFLASIFSGLLPLFPASLRLPVVLGLAVAFLWSLKDLLRLAWPSRHQAMRRIEAQSQLSHRPVSAHEDRLPEASADPVQQAIWQEHKLRQLRQLATLRIGQPRSIWRDLDPRALRLPAALALLASLLLGQGGPFANFTDSFALAPRTQIQGMPLDAWLKPPAYTAKAPLMLTSPAMIERLQTEPEIAVPENSTLTLRLSGADAPRLSFHEITGADAPEIEGIVSSTKLENGLFQSETRLTRPAVIKLMDGGSEIASWRIALIPDQPPTVAITEDPVGDASGTLSVKWKAADDYGVTGIAAEISLSDTQDDGLGIDGNGIFLYDAPKFPIALRKASPKEEAATASADLTQHPWAGFMVEMVLEAKDAAGHKGLSGTHRFRLPERPFVKPLAKALIEQRRHLILKPDEQGQVAQMLEALLAYPDGLIEGSGDYLAIAAILSRLNSAAAQDDVDLAVNMLWETATGIEDGTMADARAELEALRRELEKALAEGAPPERIAELMDKMRSAMDRYMQSLARETEKRQRQGNLEQSPQPDRFVSPEDLKKMLDMIEKLAESGANDAAKELLSQLDRILRNLQPGMQAGPMPQQGNSALSKMLDELSKLMRKQQGLMDETQRMREPGEGDQSDPNGLEQGSRSERYSPDALAGWQAELNELLEELMRQMDQNGLRAPPSLGEAGKNMQGAEGALRGGERESALEQQGEAIAKLREGTKGMARDLIQQGQGQQGTHGRHGEARGEHDPLGRPMPYSGEDTGPDDNMVPTELMIGRVREILDELRARAGALTSQGNKSKAPKLELDYIDRLLRGLY
ncbi:MAG: TIGR02302 family protein [Aestuariivirga sp.]